jgi:hypothetical protein
MRATRFRAAGSRSGLPPTIRSRLSPSSLEDARVLSEKKEGEGEVKIDGWLKSVRGHKNVIFAEVNDGSSSEGLQAVFKGQSRVAGYVCSKSSLLSPYSSSPSSLLLLSSGEGQSL